MKALKKVSALAISALLLGAAACGSPSGSSDSVFPVPPEGYRDPNTAFTTYNNKDYNEYLTGDKTTISNQWEGYGIGDPFVMRHNGMYYLYCSTLDSELGVRGYKSSDLVRWSPMTGEGLREGYVSQDNVTKAAYAPEVYYWNGTFYMYTSPGGGGHYVLTAERPEGPFVKATNNFGLSIDGSVLIDDDESMYFTYADNGGIRMAKMDSMLSVDTKSTPRLNNTSIGGWTEGSYILKRDGVYYLTYTGNHVASDGYRIAYSTADAVVTSEGGIYRDAFTRAENNPLALETEGSLKGIGHSSTVMGPDMDSHYLVYHTLNSSGGPNRSLGIDRLLFNGRQMSVAPNLEGSVAPTGPEFYATGTDAEKFDVSGAFTLSKTTAPANFTAEYNLSGMGSAAYVFAYRDDKNYASVGVDLTAKTVTLSECRDGTVSAIAAGALINDFSADKLHTVRVAARDGKVDVVFDNMTKIDGASMTLFEGKIGYKSLIGGAQVGYTAYSDVAMGMSDQREAKQALGITGASAYLYDNTYNQPYKLSDKSGISLVEEAPFAGVKSLTLGGDYDYVSYLVNFKETGRYGLELVYRAADGGKKIGVKLDDGTVWRCTLPRIETEEEYVKALIGEVDAEKGIRLLRLENLGKEINFLSFRFVEASGVTPVYEQSLAEYASKGADYKTIWKLKDGGHYAKAGTRQLVYFGNNTITDFTLEVEVKLEGKTGTSTAGIVFHAKNYAASSHDSYMSMQGYYLALNNNQIVLERLNYADGSKNVATLVRNNPFAESDRFIPLKIQARGNHIAVWSGGTQLVDVADARAFVSGKIGLYTNGAAAVFRNLKIYA